MSRKFLQHFADPKGILINAGGGDGYADGALADGTAIPTDGTSGYESGCLFLLRGQTSGNNLYQNFGSNTSCQFVPVGGFDPVVSITSSARTMTASDSGKTFTLNRAGGIAVTLPVPVAGMWFRFVVQTTFTGAASIKSAAGTHIMIGHAILGNDSDNTTVMWQALAASTFDTIDMFGTANSTGGIAGQTIDIKALSSTVWMVEIQGDAAGTEATPFQDTVA
jgi:hypothetical protein